MPFYRHIFNSIFLLCCFQKWLSLFFFLYLLNISRWKCIGREVCVRASGKQTEDILWPNPNLLNGYNRKSVVHGWLKRRQWKNREMSNGIGRVLENNREGITHALLVLWLTGCPQCWQIFNQWVHKGLYIVREFGQRNNWKEINNRINVLFSLFGPCFSRRCVFQRLCTPRKCNMWFWWNKGVTIIVFNRKDRIFLWTKNN